MGGVMEGPAYGPLDDAPFAQLPFSYVLATELGHLGASCAFEEHAGGMKLGGDERYRQYHVGRSGLGSTSLRSINLTQPSDCRGNHLLIVSNDLKAIWIRECII